MPLYEITKDSFRTVSSSSLAEMNVRERDDLQRLLRTQIEVLADDLYVITEEFGDWEDSRRRIDLLAIDKNANLVVIELKRTNDGGHMELQAVRYASMISTMTFARAVQVHAEFLARLGEKEADARQRILEFLDWVEPDEEDFGADVRIILVSQDFGRELTTAVLWLREYGVDISCVRLRPYQNGASRFIDVQQIIPLPEAREYQVQLREKEQEGRKTRAERYDERLRFWKSLVLVARARKTRHADIKPGSHSWLAAGSGIRGLSFVYVAHQECGFVELYIDRRDEEQNKRIFDQLLARREAIERSFGGQLSWERLDGRRASRIRYMVETVGYRSEENQWPRLHNAMVDAMTKLESALEPALASLAL